MPCIISKLETVEKNCCSKTMILISSFKERKYKNKLQITTKVK